VHTNWNATAFRGWCIPPGAPLRQPAKAGGRLDCAQWESVIDSQHDGSDKTAPLGDPFQNLGGLWAKAERQTTQEDQKLKNSIEREGRLGAFDLSAFVFPSTFVSLTFRSPPHLPGHGRAGTVSRSRATSDAPLSTLDPPFHVDVTPGSFRSGQDRHQESQNSIWLCDDPSRIRRGDYEFTPRKTDDALTNDLPATVASNGRVR